MTNKKIFLFVITSVFLIIGLSAVTAEDLSDNSTSVDTSDVIQETSQSTHVESQTTLQQEKKTQESIKTTDDTNIQKNEKNIKKANTIVINNQTFNTYFTNKYLNDKVSSGDTLDFQGQFLGEQYSMIIDKPVNIISSTKDAYICLNTTSGDFFGGDDVSAFTVVRGGSYTNISDIYFYNSQIFIKNANHMIINNISAIVEDRIVGRGVGQTAIRDNSSFITLENSTISTKDNQGSTSLALSWANNCIIRNNKIIGIGFVGNIFYLNTFNVENLPTDENGKTDFRIVNANNIIENNILIGPDNPADICYGICLSGTNNTIRNNTINYTGQGINPMYQIHDYDMNTTVVNNTLNGCNFYAPQGLTIINNTVTGYLRVNKNCTLENNNVKQILFATDNVKITNQTIGYVFLENGRKNITIENCTINDNITIKGSSRTNVPINITINNNQINGDVYLNGSNPLTLSNNNITGQVILGSRNYNKNLNITDNIIATDEEYTIVVNTTVTGLNISENHLLAKNSTGNASIYFKSINNQFIVKNDYLLLTDDNYNYFFDTNAIQNSDIITDNKTIEVFSDIHNKNFIFNNASIKFSNPYNHTIYNTTISLTNNSKVTIDGLIINNTNKENVININSSDNQIIDTQILLISSKAGNAITVEKNNNKINNLIIKGQTPKGSILASVNNASNLNITNSQFESDNSDGINITKSTNVLVDNNFINVTSDYTVNIINSNNTNVTNNALYAKRLLGDASVNKIQSTTSVHDNNNINNNIVTITGNLTIFTPTDIKILITDILNNPLEYVDANITINNQRYTPKFTNGTTTISYTPTNTNDVNITITQAGSNKIANTTNTTLKVNRINTTTTVTPVNGLTNHSITIDATVKDALDNKVNEGIVTFVDNTGKTLGTANVTDGVASINTTYASVGVYNITATYSNSRYYKTSNAKFTATIVNVKLTITGSLVALTKGNITVKVTDSNNKPITTGSVAVKVNNVAQSVSFKNGVATVSYTPQNANGLNVGATYTSPDKITVTTTETLTVNKISTNTIVPSIKGLVGQTVTITVTVKDALNNNVKEGIVTFMGDDGKDIDVTLSNGVANITRNYNTMGVYNMTVTYYNSSTYKNSMNTSTITIGKVNLSISGNPVALTKSNITVKVTDENNKTVTTGSVAVNVNNVAQSVSFKNGVATVSYTPQNTNKLNITATYTTADKFTVNKTATLNVAQISTKTTVTSVKGLVGQQLTLKATVKDANNNNVKDGVVVFVDNTGKTLATVKVSNGIASTTISYNAAGVYNITASYSNASVYKSSTAKATATIGKVNLAITGSLTALTKGDITVKVTDENNKAVTTGSVAVKVNNVAQTVSFKNGVATVSYTPLNTDKLNVAATYTAADKFTVNSTSTLTVAKISTKLTITSNNTKPRVNDKVKLTITLKDNNNNAATNKNLTVTVNNKNYNVTTDKTGTATVNYTMNKNYANLTANAKFAGDSIYKESTKTLTINRTFTTDVKLLTGSFDAKPGDTVKLIAHITDNGLDINGGQLVFKIDGKTLTDISGNAVKVNIKDGFAILEYKIPDTLSAGTRNLSATFSSGKYSGRLSTPMLINKLVTHIDVNPLYTTGNTIQVKAQVVDQNNQALNKQTAMCIKFNGKSYNFNTTTGTINYQISQTLKDGYYNLTIIAGANGKYLSSTVNTVVIKSSAAIKTNYINNTLNNRSTANSGDIKTGKYMSLLTGASTVKPGDTLKLIAHVTTGGIDITGGQLGFKIDGLTLTDSKNNKVFTPKDGLAILEYKVPDTLSAGTRTLSTVYSSKTYGDERLNSTLTMNKLNTHIEAQPIYTTSSTPTIQATILDDNNELINKQTKVVIKIDGKSYSINNDNGKISYKVPSNLSKGLHQITIIAGENGKYLSSRANTVIIKT